MTKGGAGTVWVTVAVDVDVMVVVGVGRFRHEQAWEMAEDAKAITCEGKALALRFASSRASSSSDRRCLADGVGGFPGRKT